jgi:hypothetical protein
VAIATGQQFSPAGSLPEISHRTQLEYGFAEGMGSRHKGMPQIQFSADQVFAILHYLGSITGTAPSERLRFGPQGETPP